MLGITSILLFIAGSKIVVETVPIMMFDSGYGASSSLILYIGILSKSLSNESHYILIGIS
jgi:hypothetical protein